MRYLLKITICLFGSMVAWSAYADDGIQFFLGGSAGVSYTENNVSSTTGSTDLEEIDAGFKVYGGIKANKYFGLEMHVANLGGLELSGNAGDGFTTKSGGSFTFSSNTTVETQTRSTGVGPTLTLPITDWFKPFFKAGYHYWDVKATETQAGTTYNFAADGFDPFYGGGIDFNVYEGLNIRTEYEYFVLEDLSVSFLSAGAYYQF